MDALDVMSTPVISVKPEMTVREVAKVFVEQRISGAPVVDAAGHIVGMISEGDLIHRTELDTDKPQRRGWLDLFSLNRDASEYVKSHGLRVADVMITDVVSVDETTPLGKVADLMETRRIKRVPVKRQGTLVGIVTRANLVQVLASMVEEPATLDAAPNDREIRAMLMGELAGRSWAFAGRNIVVRDGVVHLWGMFQSVDAVKAVLVAAEATPGVKRVEDHTESYPVFVSGL
ncbi:CBS domain-containing protein [Paraburkholderia sp. BL10I2N1]|uniref:CBS domain-containing protein n=1 Tax=Paraburkholderia sp. BL10I2N1 TaxID=1938796 RepID=UPI00106029FB|nr:CBS domain-containing protein [Paraburkholderia sp. BL10I2N1]TDN63202.1 BON domain-containing protein [Paraburkholderia sp. BL10I2N1]